jgi:Flp pilus assembly pilin Flp
MGSEGHVGQACSKCIEWLRETSFAVRRRIRQDSGANLIEYALLVSLIALVCVSALRFFQGNVNSKLSCTAAELSSATDGTC